MAANRNHARSTVDAPHRPPIQELGYAGASMTSPSQTEDENGPPAFEDLTDEDRERERAKAHQTAIEAALEQLRAGDPDTARRTLAARLDEAERCPICGARDGEVCNAVAHGEALRRK